MTDEEKIIILDLYCRAEKAYILSKHWLNKLYKKSRASVSDEDIKSAKDKEGWECAKAYGIELICRAFRIELPPHQALCEKVKAEHKIKCLYVD